MKKVSVIMGVYNAENTIRESIESILNQSYTEWELIICDDCSKDNSYKIIKEYEKLYPSKIKILKNKENLKLARTLNNCLKVATGEYIARMDADDICLKERFEKQVEFLIENVNYDVVGSSAIIFDENGEKFVRKILKTPEKNDIPKGAAHIHPSIMMRKEVYEELNGYTESKKIIRGQDIDLWFRFYAKGHKGFNMEEPLIKYRESFNDLKKRKIKYSFDMAINVYNGCKLLGVPFHKYVYVLKPIIAAITPNSILYFYHNLGEKNG